MGISNEAERIEAAARLLRGAAREVGIVTGDDRVSEAVAAQLLGLTQGGLKNLRHEGDAPTAYRVPVGGSRTSYRIADLAKWVEARRFR